MQPQN